MLLVCVFVCVCACVHLILCTRKRTDGQTLVIVFSRILDMQLETCLILTSEFFNGIAFHFVMFLPERQHKGCPFQEWMRGHCVISFCGFFLLND